MYTVCVQVIDVFKAANSVGLTVMRMWAYNDGADSYAALQPKLGQLDPRILRYRHYESDCHVHVGLWSKPRPLVHCNAGEGSLIPEV